MRKLRAFCLVCAFFSTFLTAAPLFAQESKPMREAVIFGGNDDNSDYNIFRTIFVDLSSGLKARGWGVTALYDDKDARCVDSDCDGVNAEKWSVAPVAKALGEPDESVGHASRKELFDALDDAIKKLPPKSEFLLVVENHGSPDWGDGGHGWLLPDGSLLSVRDPELLGKLQALRDKGVKIGIIDGSCYGGITVQALSSYGCVLSTQAKDSLSNQENFNDTAGEAGTTAILGDLLRHPEKVPSLALSGQNPAHLTLEQIFLDSLLHDPYNTPDVLGDWNWAQISGFEVDPHLYHWGERIPEIFALLSAQQENYYAHDFIQNEVCPSAKEALLEGLRLLNDMSLSPRSAEYLARLKRYLGPDKKVIQSPANILQRLDHLDEMLSEFKNDAQKERQWIGALLQIHYVAGFEASPKLKKIWSEIIDVLKMEYGDPQVRAENGRAYIHVTALNLLAMESTGRPSADDLIDRMKQRGYKTDNGIHDAIQQMIDATKHDAERQVGSEARKRYEEYKKQTLTLKARQEARLKEIQEIQNGTEELFQQVEFLRYLRQRDLKKQTVQDCSGFELF